MPRHGAYVLLADADSTDDQGVVTWPGGPCYFMSEGTWGGGSATLEYKTPNGTWIAVPSGAHTANTITSLTVPAGSVRVTVATASAVYSYLVANPSAV